MNVNLKSLGLAALLGGAARRRSRSPWARGRTGYFGGATSRRSTRRGGLLGSALVAGAAYWFARRRKSAARGGSLAPVGHEAVPEI